MERMVESDPLNITEVLIVRVIKLISYYVLRNTRLCQREISRPCERSLPIFSRTFGAQVSSKAPCSTLQVSDISIVTSCYLAKCPRKKNHLNKFENNET